MHSQPVFACKYGLRTVTNSRGLHCALCLESPVIRLFSVVLCTTKNHRREEGGGQKLPIVQSIPELSDLDTMRSLKNPLSEGSWRGFHVDSLPTRYQGAQHVPHRHSACLLKRGLPAIMGKSECVYAQYLQRRPLHRASQAHSVVFGVSRVHLTTVLWDVRGSCGDILTHSHDHRRQMCAFQRSRSHAGIPK